MMPPRPFPSPEGLKFRITGSWDAARKVFEKLEFRLFCEGCAQSPEDCHPRGSD